MSLPQICTTNVFPDGNMEVAGTADYSTSSSAVLSKESSDRVGSAQLLRATYNAVSNPGFTAVDTFEVGKTYRVTGWVRISQAGGPQPVIYESTLGEIWRGTALQNSWQFFDITFTSQSSAGPIFFSDVNTGTEYSEWDDLFLCEVVSDAERVEKQYFYRVYDKEGTFIKTWADVINAPSFSSYINTGPSELKLSLARTFADFGEGNDAHFDNRVDVLVHDKDVTATGGKLLYSGWISAYEPKLSASNEGVAITLLPYAARLGFDILTVSGGLTTQANFNSVDPSNIAQTILDNYNITASGLVNYDTSSIHPTGTVVSYDFNAVDYRQALDKVLELTPQDWYWRIDADNIYTLKRKNYLADHTLNIGKEIQDISIFKNAEQIVNVVLFTGGKLPSGEILYKEYINQGSIDVFGRRVLKVQDGRVTNETTAGTIANKIIYDKGSADVRVSIKVIDNNINRSFGYDIESFDVGETVSINTPDKILIESLWDVSEWDVDFWDFGQEYILAEPLQINAISYTPDYAVLELSSRNPEVSKRIQDVDRNLSNYINKDVEGSPS